MFGVPADKISVQPMGVDLENRFTPDESVTRSNSELLFVGRLVEKKGVRYLLEGAAKDHRVPSRRVFDRCRLWTRGIGPAPTG